MAFRLNQGGEAARAAAAEPGITEELPSGKEVFRADNNKRPWFQQKKGSVFPAKKKLVKKMMVDSIAKFLSSLFISPESSFSSKMASGGCSSKMTTTSSSTATPSSKSFNGKKRKEMFPDP